jgi:energy-coupling factor transporter ATP-binding protein EcfA2
MKLTFVRPHASIVSLPPQGIELGKLTVITGVNGSGKSQLLEAIENGCVVTDVAKQEEVLRRDWQTFVPVDVGPTAARAARQHRVELFDKIERQRSRFEQLFSMARQQALDLTGLSSRADILALDINEIRRRSPDPDKAQAIWDNLRSADHADHQNLRGFSVKAYSELEQVAQALGKNLLDLKPKDVDQDVLTTWGMTPFQATYVQPFVDYRNLHIKNNLARLREEDGDTAIRSLSKEEFVAKHGEMPWVVLNRALVDARLPFVINHPSLVDQNEEYIPRLTKVGTDIELPFSRLSSGEKILMSLAITVYYGVDERFSPAYPKLLLLDEVDAPLHPSMARDFLRIIEKTLIDQQGLHVILTTHAASTVALAPEDSIAIMAADGDRLQKASKAEALNLLTDGVPTLALDYTGRRQVFVESPADVVVCSCLYELLLTTLPSGRSLEFVSTGAANPKTRSDDNTGVDNTLRVVKMLVENGNQSVFALVDADKKKRVPEPASRQYVFAQGKRDGLENCIYDPVIVLLLVARHAQSQFPAIGISKTTTDTDIAKMPAPELQVLVDKLQSYLLGPPTTVTQYVEATYLGGLTLRLRSEYLSYDDHDLEELILEKIGGLRAYGSGGGNAGARMVRIVNSEMRAYPEFIPVDLVETFRDLLDADTHIA